jgi:hypothetical protein
MDKKKNYWLKEIATAFGMNIKDFADCMGYSRQSLYQGACGMTNLDKRRLAVSEYKLDVINQKLYEAEKAKADEMFQKRRKLIDSMIDRLGG